MNSIELKTLIKESLQEVLAEGKNQDPTKEEMMHFLQQQFGRYGEEGFADSSEIAMYWFANHYHGGQWSNLYSVLSTSQFSPGPISRGPEPESMEADMYQALEAQFGGKEHQHGTESPHSGEDDSSADVMQETPTFQSFPACHHRHFSLKDDGSYECTDCGKAMTGDEKEEPSLQEDGAAGGGTGMGMSVTGAVQGYSTPNAFRKKKVKENEQPEPYDAETDQFAPGPRSRTSEVSPENKFNAEIDQLKKQYPTLSFGYIGNIWNERGMPKDDRAWYVFNGRTKFGGYSTKDLPAMWDRWQKHKEKFLKGEKGPTMEAAGSERKPIPSKVNKAEVQKALAAIGQMKNHEWRPLLDRARKNYQLFPDDGNDPQKLNLVMALQYMDERNPSQRSMNEAPQSETHFERLDQALTAVEEYVIKNRIQVDTAEHPPNEVDPHGIREPFLYGGIPYGQTKQADYKLLAYKGQKTRKYMHVVIYRTEQGRYELNVYTL
jgi:hypothetical protein